MDGCVRKGIHPETLFEETQGRAASPGQEPAPAEEESAHEVLDSEALLERVDGDLELLQEMTGIFHEDYLRLLGAIREAVRSRDAVKLSRAAHTLKGAFSNFSAGAAVAAAFRLEQLGRNGDLSHAAEALSRLEWETERLMPQLAQVGQEASK